MRRTLLAIAFTLGLGTAAGAQMQCEGQLIQAGDTEERVLDLCGAPTKRVRRQSPWPGGLADSPASYAERVEIEEWTYNLGPGRFVRRLTFENGVLQTIVEGNYGD